MCGLAGQLWFNGKSRVAAEQLSAMSCRIAHRGPDASGLWVSGDGSIGLAHRRLAIIDLSAAAAQPMANDDGSVRLVFNGEIYNHAELRSQLNSEARIRWQTDHSDTEVILRAYERWGIECLDRLRGMFALAIWDSRNDCLWLVRDRMGIKPLYYSLHSGQLAFASEIKALLEIPGQPRAVHSEALHNYLLFMCTPGDQTLFAGIRKLEPGTLLRASRGGQVHVSRWYEVWDHVRPELAAKGDALYDQVLDMLTDSVSVHKASDVPVGVFLSGGVDSSTNATLFSHGGKTPVSTFSIGYHGEHRTITNEVDNARRLAGLLHADHHERLLSEDDLLEFLPRMIDLQDEPVADPVCVPLYYLSRLARDNGVIVCQVGEGADELFAGYPLWQSWIRLQQAANSPVGGPAASTLAGLMRSMGMKDRREFDVLSRIRSGQPVFAGTAQGFTTGQCERILSPAYRARFRGRDASAVIAPIWDHFNRASTDPSVVNWMTYLELRIRLPEMLLMRVDKMSMGASVETRVPFLDHPFVELALSIPQSRKLHGRESKHVLKRAVRGVIPDDIIDQPKRGFGVPIKEWMAGRLGDRMQAELKQFCAEHDYFDPAGIESVFRSESRVRVWYLYNFVLWHRHFIEGHPIERPLP